MKSLVIPAILALAIHWAIFSLKLPTEKPRLLLPETRSVTVMLTAITPEPVEKVAPLPAVESLPIAPLTPLALKKQTSKSASKPQPKPKPKPKPKLEPKSEPPSNPPVASTASQQPAPAPEKVATDHPATADQAPSSATALSASPEPVVPAPGRKGDEENQAKITTSVPLYDVNPPMGYPPLARRRNLEGTVLLRVLVDARGLVGEIHLVRSSGYGILDRWAEKNVSRWQFQPATRNGKPIDFWVEVPVVFKLQ